MHNSDNDPIPPEQQPRRTGNRGIVIGALVVVALLVIAWIAIGSDMDEQPVAAQTGSEPAAAVTEAPVADAPVDEETIDVDEVTDDTPLPMEDENPNPVVPQDALIPPAPVESTPQD